MDMTLWLDHAVLQIVGLRCFATVTPNQLIHYDPYNAPSSECYGALTNREVRETPNRGSSTETATCRVADPWISGKPHIQHFDSPNTGEWKRSIHE